MPKLWLFRYRDTGYAIEKAYTYGSRNRPTGINIFNPFLLRLALWNTLLVREKKGKSLYKRDKKGDYAFFFFFFFFCIR